MEIHSIRTISLILLVVTMSCGFLIPDKKQYTEAENDLESLQNLEEDKPWNSKLLQTHEESDAGELLQMIDRFLLDTSDADMYDVGLDKRTYNLKRLSQNLKKRRGVYTS